MESKQVTSADDDDFYPMNDEESSNYHIEDDLEVPENQNQEGIPEPEITAKMELFRYQENLFKEIASKKSAPIRYELGTGSYFDYHLNRFSLKFQEKIDENDLALNVFFALQEFIQAFKNCKIEDTEARAAGLSGYLNQIKDDVDREYEKAPKKAKAARIIEYNELIRFLEEALLWRIEHYNTDFPDIREKDISEGLVKIEAEIKSQYVNLNKEDLWKLLQRLREMKICPLWHQKVCKRLQLRQGILRLIYKIKREDFVLRGEGSFQKDLWQNDKGLEEYTGEVSDRVFEEIKMRRLQVLEEKEKIIIDEAEYKVSDSFKIPSGYIIGGTYFDQKMKEKANELEVFSLRNGDFPVIKALKQMIELVNLLFNTPCEYFFFVRSMNGILAMVKDQQSVIKTSKEMNAMTAEIMVFMMRFEDIMEEILDWKAEAKSTHGDVKNSEAEEVLRLLEIPLPIYEEYMINVTRLSVYMTEADYIREVVILIKELDRLLKARLAVKNMECVERFDGLVVRLEGIIEGLKQVYKVRDKNYQALRKIYEGHKYKIGKASYSVVQRDLKVNEFNVLVEDFNKRFGDKIDYQTRNYYLSWVEELRILQIGGNLDVIADAKKSGKKGIKIQRATGKVGTGMVQKILPASLG